MAFKLLHPQLARGSLALLGARRTMAAAPLLTPLLRVAGSDPRASKMPFVVVAAATAAGTAMTLAHGEGETVAGVPTAGLHPVANVSELEVVLYQYQPCPFCNKVRAFLDFHKVHSTLLSHCADSVPRCGSQPTLQKGACVLPVQEGPGCRRSGRTGIKACTAFSDLPFPLMRSLLD